MCTLSFCYNVIHPLNLIENKHFKWTANNPIKSSISSSIRRVQLWIVNMNVFGGDNIKIASGLIKIRIWIKMPDILSVTPLWCDMILIACWDIDFLCQILFQPGDHSSCKLCGVSSFILFRICMWAKSYYDPAWKKCFCHHLIIWSKSCIEERAKVSHNGVKGDGIEYKGFYY